MKKCPVCFWESSSGIVHAPLCDTVRALAKTSVQILERRTMGISGPQFKDTVLLTEHELYLLNLAADLEDIANEGEPEE